MIQTLRLNNRKLDAAVSCSLMLQLLRQLVTFVFPRISLPYGVCHRASVCTTPSSLPLALCCFAVAGADCIGQPSAAQFIWGSRCVTSLLNDLGVQAFSQFFQHVASTRNDQIGRTQLREYWLYHFFFFSLTLKPVTNPQRGNNKLWKTTYRASSSCGNEVPWTPTICLTTICVEFLKPDKGCNFVYRESICD